MGDVNRRCEKRLTDLLVRLSDANDLLMSCWLQWAYDNQDGTYNILGLSTLGELATHLVGIGRLEPVDEDGNNYRLVA